MAKFSFQRNLMFSYGWLYIYIYNYIQLYGSKYLLRKYLGYDLGVKDLVRQCLDIYPHDTMTFPL